MKRPCIVLTCLAALNAHADDLEVVTEIGALATPRITSPTPDRSDDSLWNTSAGKLHLQCKQTVAVIDASSVSDSFPSVFCAGYLLGLFESYYFANVFCPDGFASEGQLARMYVEYMEAHPERGRDHRLDAAMQAFSRAWPCKQPRPLPSRTVLLAQESLSRIGYKPGPVDGFLGTRTRAAIRAFQEDNDMPVDGRLTDETLSAIAGMRQAR